MDFDKIVLSKGELKILRSLQKKLVAYDFGKNEMQERIKEHGFAYSEIVHVDGEPFTRLVITPNGINYLRYIDMVKKKTCRDSIRYLITTAIAVIALIKAFMPEILLLLGL